VGRSPWTAADALVGVFSEPDPGVRADGGVRPTLTCIAIFRDRTLAASGRTSLILATAGSTSFDAALLVRGWSLFDCDGHFV
jgi:hypothetical protein